MSNTVFFYTLGMIAGFICACLYAEYFVTPEIIHLYDNRVCSEVFYDVGDWINQTRGGYE